MDLATLMLLAAGLAAAGLVTGFLSGLLGVGGGGILVPVLYEVFSALGVDPAVRMHMTLGTSFAVIVATSITSFAGHRRRGAVDMPALRRLGPWVVAGVVAGIFLVERATGTALKLVWIALGTLMCLKMVFGRDDWRLGDNLPRTPAFNLVPMLIGCASTLMSIGGGAFMVTLLTLHGRPIIRAVATSSGFGPLIAIPGVIGYIWAGWGIPGRPTFALGYVSVLAAALIIPSCFAAVPWGVATAHGISRRTLERAFAAFLALVVLRFAVSFA